MKIAWLFSLGGVHRVLPGCGKIGNKKMNNYHRAVKKPARAQVVFEPGLMAEGLDFLFHPRAKIGINEPDGSSYQGTLDLELSRTGMWS